jgi:hypothetical protein
VSAHVRPWFLLAAVVACTPKETKPSVPNYDGPVAAALAALAKDCVGYGISAGEPVDKAANLRCTAPDAEVTIHLDPWRRLRGVQIHLLAATTEEAHARLDTALTPIIDDHHRANTLTHLDDPVPGGVTPIPQLTLEKHLYQVASEPLPDDDRKRYVFKLRID